MKAYEEFIKNIEKELEETKENERIGTGVAVENYYAGYISGLRMALALAPKAEEIKRDLAAFIKK